MDTRTGEIYDSGIIKQLIASGAIVDRSRFQPMQKPPTEKQMSRNPPRIGRNDACPCGSGKKFKQCCLRDPNDERFVETGGKP